MNIRDLRLFSMVFDGPFAHTHPITVGEVDFGLFHYSRLAVGPQKVRRDVCRPFMPDPTFSSRHVSMGVNFV
jgi:hypothetical protein